MPEGELTVRMPRRIPAGEAVVRLEAPRGEVFYFIKSNGTDKPGAAQNTNSNNLQSELRGPVSSRSSVGRCFHDPGRH